MDKIYQIFVSSTFEDLKLERQEAMAAVVSTGNVPVGMEYFPAGDASPFDYIKQQIDSVDYYVLIIAGKYGSINKKTGLSYTEMEFNYAVEKGVPIAVLQYRDITKLTGEKLEMDDPKKRKLLDEFRKKSKEGRVADFWESSVELRMKVKDAINNLIKNSPRIGWIRANQAYILQEKKTIEELKKKNERSKIFQYGNLLESILLRYLISIFNVTTPFEERNSKRPDDYFSYSFDFSFNDMSDMYKTSLMLTDPSYKPGIAVYFENQDKLYSELRNMYTTVDFSDYYELGNVIHQLLKNCNDFGFRGSILEFATTTLNNHNTEMLSKLIKEHKGELIMRESNALNQFVALYYFLHQNAVLAQQIYRCLKNL